MPPTSEQDQPRVLTELEARILTGEVSDEELFKLRFGQSALDFGESPTKDDELKGTDE